MGRAGLAPERQPRGGEAYRENKKRQGERAREGNGAADAAWRGAGPTRRVACPPDLKTHPSPPTHPPSTPQVRAAYLAKAKAVHPDLAGPADRAVRLPRRTAGRR